MSIRIKICGITNLRDLGGYATTDGATVAAGLVYRSNQLSGISPADMTALADLGLITSGQPGDEVVQARQPGRGIYLILRGVGPRQTAPAAENKR